MEKKIIDNNIFMLVVIVAIAALVIIGISLFKKPCPSDLEVYTAKKTYEIGEEVHLSVKSKELPDITAFEWSTENGEKVTEPSPVFIFDSTGLQHVTVKVNNSCTYKHTIEIVNEEESDYPKIVIGDISVSPEKICAGKPVAFTDNSENVSAWWWDFGDDNTTKRENPKHIYKKAGIYVVKRMLNSGEGELTASVIVKVEDCTGKPFRASFSSSKSSVMPGESVEFRDKTPNAKSWFWDFGDRYNSQEKNPIHPYDTSGIYNVSLYVNGDKKSLVTKQIEVKTPKIAEISNRGERRVDITPQSKVDKPVADVNEEIQFTDNTQGAKSWSWDFGNGATSTQRNPRYAYSSPGEYWASLRVNGGEVKSRHFMKINGYTRYTPPPTPIVVKKEEIKPIRPPAPIVVKEEEIKKPISPPTPKPKSTPSTVGSAAATYSSSCLSSSSSSYSFSITPRQDIELLSFKVGSNECGGLKVTMSSSKGTQSTKSALIAGQSQISLDGFYLEAGVTYTISCATITGYGSCNSSQQPDLQDSSACASPGNSSHFTADYRGKSIIHELKYLY